jgi:hypothetical protein
MVILALKLEIMSRGDAVHATRGLNLTMFELDSRSVTVSFGQRKILAPNELARYIFYAA